MRLSFFAVLIILASLCAGQPLSAGRDTLLIRITRPGLLEYTDYVYAPYSALWVEDKSGRLIRILFATLYFDDGDNLSTACSRTSYFPSLTYFYGRHGCPPDDGTSITASQCPDYGPPPDAVTGCSEKNSSAAPTVFTRTWDLTDMNGNPVITGTYRIFYNSVAMDESFDPTDKLWAVTFELSESPMDTAVANPSPLDIGHPGFSSHTVDLIEVSCGGRSANPGGNRNGGDFLNLTPSPPTVKAPEPKSFCGNDGAVSAFIVLLGLKAMRRFGNRRKKNKS